MATTTTQRAPQRNCCFYLPDEAHHAAKLAALKEKKAFSQWCAEVIKARLVQGQKREDKKDN